MNDILIRRKQLSKNNYILKADSSTNYWFGLSQEKIKKYKDRFNEKFYIILYGDKDLISDFYSIPYVAIKDLLITSNLYPKRKRWVGDIKNNILRLRNSPIERNISSYYSLPVYNVPNANYIMDSQADYAIENARREINVRLKQSKFRKSVLDNFSKKCCITGISEENLLVASHIIPWCDKIESRLDPKNGLCLFYLYDKLYDQGYFTIGRDYRIKVTSRLDKLSENLKQYLLKIDRKIITAPIHHKIDGCALSYHEAVIFDNFVVKK